MATLPEVEAAFLKADAAGDTQSAQVLANEVRRLRAQPAPVGSPSVVKGSIGGGIGMGLRDPLDAGAQMLTHALPDSVVNAGNEFNNWLAGKGVPGISRIEGDGAGGVDQMVRGANAEYAASRQMAGRDGIDVARLAGNIAATAPIAMAGLPAAGLGARTAASALSGATFGALQPVENPGQDFWSQKGKQAALGGAMGGVAPVLTNALARIISPKSSASVQNLLNEGVTPTPGQVLGGTARSIEEKAGSIPFLGSAIKMGERRATEQMNTAAFNRALAPIGETMPKGMVGHEAVKHVEETLGKRYSQVLDQVGPVQIDQPLVQELQRHLGSLSGVPARAKQYLDTIQSVVADKARNGTLNGQQFKDIESSLGQKATEYMRSMDPDQRALGKAFQEAQRSMRGWLERVAPEGVAGDLANANKGWAAFVRTRNASGMQGADEGVFSAAQLSSGVRRADKSVGHGSFAKGDALMQDLSGSAKAVLGGKVPDSGTAGRAMAGAMILGPLAGTPVSPFLALAALPSVAYMPGIQRGLASLLAGRQGQAWKAGSKNALALTPGMTALLAASGNGLLNP